MRADAFVPASAPSGAGSALTLTKDQVTLSVPEGSRGAGASSSEALEPLPPFALGGIGRIELAEEWDQSRNTEAAVQQLLGG